jgi:photosystem II stability/assembly factor-like uncharacterized protein
MNPFFLTLLLLCASAASAQNQWQLINQSNSRCATINFVTTQIGWSSSIYAQAPPNNFGLYKTIDGGENWNGVLSWMNVYVPYIAFFNERRGFASAGSWASLTSDGDTWNSFALPETTEVERSVYLDSTTLIGISNRMISGDSLERQINKSTDGGQTWQNLYRDHHVWMLGPKLARSQGGTLLVPGDAHEMLRSTDRGNTWQTVDTSPWFAGTPAAADSGLFFQGTVTMGLHHAEICRSVDDGLTWTNVWTDTTQDGHFLGPDDIKFADRLHGWVAWYHGWMSQTSDGGETWQSYQLPHSIEGVSEMSFIDSTLGWAIDPGVGSPTLVYRWSTMAGVQNEWTSTTIASDLRITSVYPNPFNSQTTISFTVPKTEHVTVTVYDLLGHPAGILTSRLLVSGSYQLNWEGSNYASGVYFLRVCDGEHVATSKLHLIR